MADRGRMIALDLAANRVDRVPELSLRIQVTEAGSGNPALHAVLPDEGALRDAAAAVLAMIGEACGGATPSQWPNRPFDAWQSLPAPLLAIGHPGCNGLLRRLYYLGYLDDTDTPADGFTLKLATNPLGDGHHAIALCARRPAEVLAAGRRLVSALRRDGQGRFWDEPWYVVPARNGLPDPERYTLEHGSPPPTFSGHPGGPLGALAHLVATGDPRWGRAFVATLRPFAEGRVPLSFWRMSAVDFWTDRLVLGWQRIEHLPCFSDTERCLIATFVKACTQYCHDSLTYQKWSITDEDLMVFNHHTFPAVGLFFGATYLERRGFATKAEATAWIAKALRVVERATQAGRSYDEGGAGYSWLVACHVLRIALARGDATYARSDRLRRYADLAVMVQNSTLRMVPFGDCGSYDAHGGGAAALLLQAATWTGDGGYKWVAAQAAPEAVAADLFCPALPMAPPSRHVGLFLLPMDPVIHAWASRPAFPGYPPPLRVPGVPADRGFDKIALRAGWDPDDDYLLLQGFGGGQHGHPDANSISQYQWGQRLLLVDCDYIRRGPAQHNTVAVIRDGHQEVPPVTARCDQVAEFPGGALLRSTLPDYGGCDWERLILWLKNDCLVVADTLTAHVPGDYDVRCYWRTLGDARASHDGMTVSQDGVWCHIVEATESCRDVSVEAPPLNTPHYPPYAHGDCRPKVLRERRLVRLNAGERMAFVNLICPSRDAGRRRQACLSDGILHLSGGVSDMTLDRGALRQDGRVLLQTDAEGLFDALSRRPPPIQAARLPPAHAAVLCRALLPAPVSALAPCAAGWLCGCEDGVVALVRRSGTVAIVGQTEGAVRCVLEGRPYGETGEWVLASGDGAVLYGWDAAGTQRLSVPLPRNAHMPAQGRALVLADLDGDGKLWPVVGTAAWRVHAVAADGALRWTFDTAAHAVTALAAHDLNADGRDEIVCATVYFCLPAITADGARLWEDEDYNDYWRAGPTFRTVVVCDLDGNGLPEVLSAAADTCVHCISARGEKIWAVSIGDEPVGLEVAHGAVWAASTDGAVHRLDASGRRLSLFRVAGNLTGLAALANGAAAADAQGTVVLMAADGRPRAVACIPEPVTGMAPNGSALAVAGARTLTVLDGR